MVTLDLDRDAVDPSLFTLLNIDDLISVIVALEPSRVHPHEHRSPILTLGASGAGTISRSGRE